MEKKLEELKEWTEEREEGVKTIIEGHFNARTRRESEEEKEEKRIPKVARNKEWKCP